jgi:hypothetical protein
LFQAVKANVQIVCVEDFSTGILWLVSLPLTFDCFDEVLSRRSASGLAASSLVGQKMTAVPNHRERQLLQYLRGRGWVKASFLPQHYRTLDGMLQKHWIERAGKGRDVAFRITEQGMIAKTTPVWV